MSYRQIDGTALRVVLDGPLAGLQYIEDQYGEDFLGTIQTQYPDSRGNFLPGGKLVEFDYLEGWDEPRPRAIQEGEGVNIPNEAIEAAAKAAYEVMPVELFGRDHPVTWEQLSESVLGRARKDDELAKARAALEAAAPIINARLEQDSLQMVGAILDSAGGTVKASRNSLLARYEVTRTEDRATDTLKLSARRI